MTKAEHQLKISIETFIISLQNYGLKDSSMVQYRSICNGIRLFAERNPNYDFPEMLNKFLSLSEENSSYCKGYQRAKRRVVRILCEIHDGKEPNLGHPKLGIINYKVPDSTLSVINDILSINKINEKERVHFSAHMRSFFSHCLENGYEWYEIDDNIILQYITDVIPIRYSGSIGRAVRVLKMITDYVKLKTCPKFKYDYSFIKIGSASCRLIKPYSENELSILFKAIDVETSVGKRNRAILLLGYQTGLRGCDILNLKLSDIDWINHKIHIIQSKTSKAVIVELNGIVMNALADYVLESRPETTAHEVFVTVNAPYQRLSRNLSSIIDKYVKIAKIEKIPLRSFHSLRRSFESILVSKGVPLETVSKMAGHSSIKSDKPYLTFDSETISFISLDLSDVPIEYGIYASNFTGRILEGENNDCK